MKTEQIITGNKLIAEFLWTDIGPCGDDGEREYQVPDDNRGIFWSLSSYYEETGCARTSELYFHSSWDWLMPVVRKIVELCCNSDNDDLFMSDHYTSILDTIPIAIIEDAYKVVVEFIEWYNAQQ